jgi:hypothetical protein
MKIIKKASSYIQVNAVSFLGMEIILTKYLNNFNTVLYISLYLLGINVNNASTYGELRDGEVCRKLCTLSG